MADLSVSPQSQAQALREINDDFETRKQDLSSEHSSKLRQIQKTYLKNEKEVRDSGDAAINHIRKDSQHRVETEADHIKENADEVLARVDNESKQQIRSTQENGIRTSETLKKQYSRDINSTHRKGESDLKDTKDKYEVELRNNENFYHSEIDQEKKQFAEDQVKLQAQYDHKRQETTEIQRKNLDELAKKYNSQFVKNADQNQESLTLQKQNFLKEVYRQQQELANKTTLYESKADDPFYLPRDLRAKLVEHEGAYVLKAKIPQPEKTNYSVHVKDNKVTLESYRSNEAKIENGVEKAETNSYQTNRQEFKLGYPVDQNKIIKEFDDDGNLTVTIPKKDFSVKA